MGLESTTARMNHMARSELYQDRILTPDEIIEAYDAVTAEDIRRLAEETFDWSRVSLLGRARWRRRNSTAGRWACNRGKRAIPPMRNRANPACRTSSTRFSK